MSYKEYKNWKSIAGDFNSPFVRNYIWTMSPLPYPTLFGVETPLIGIISKENAIEYVADLHSWKKTHEGLKAQAIKDHTFVEKIIDKTNELGEAFNAWSEKNIFTANLSVKTADDLVSLLNDYATKQAEMYSYGISLPILDIGGFNFVEGNLERYLKAHVSESEYRSYYDVFTFPLHNSFAQDQEEDLLKLMVSVKEVLPQCINIKTAQDLKEQCPLVFAKLAEHTKKHAWVYYVYMGPAYTENNFWAFIKDAITQGVDPEKKLRALDDRKKKIAELREEYISKLKPDLFNETIIRLASKIVWAKPRRKDYQSRSYYHLEKLLREIARRLNISLSQARSAPFDLIEKGLKTGAIDTSVINSVYKTHVCIPDNGKVITLYGKEAHDFEEQCVEKEKIEVEDVKEIKGVVAQPGKVTGTVKIINRPEEMEKMNQGNVLVSLATTPSVVPAMKKAAAIVTDEGGLTCHAAIVSRELGITCVIGTKIASKVLKDGDKVEVDAFKGLVTVIK